MKTLKISLIATLLYVFCGQTTAQVTFDFTGDVQTYTVPDCVYGLQIDLKGAEGAPTANGCLGGQGGRITGILSVTPGETINIYVGGKPADFSPGFNGGGQGGATTGGGGGASDIRIGGTNLSNRVVIAAGGGGGGGVGATSKYEGGAGGALIGQNGNYGGDRSDSEVRVGKGGKQSQGGAGGVASVANGSAGELGVGGTGGESAGGGGGGGLYGGGGGSSYGNGGTGGGGGSNFANKDFAFDVSHTRGHQSGNGQVKVTPLGNGPRTPGNIFSLDTVCNKGQFSFKIDFIESADSYEWIGPEGSTILAGQGSDSVVFIFGDSSGNVSVTATNGCGTSEASIKTIVVITEGGICDSTFGGGNVRPQAKDDAVSTEMDSSIIIDVLSNDIPGDITIDVSSVAEVTTVSNGSLTNNGDGSFDYLPNGGYLGDDMFTYKACAGGQCDTATVFITVYNPDDGNVKPSANDDKANTPIDVSVIIKVIENDNDPDGSFDLSSLKITSEPTNGIASVDNTNGNIEYTPSSGYLGADQFNYEICDDGSPVECDGAIVTVNVGELVGVSNSSTEAISVWPNPARDQLNVSFDSDVNILNAEVIGLSGNVLINKPVNTKQSLLSINIQAIPRSMYVLKVYTSNTILTYTFIKE